MINFVLKQNKRTFVLHGVSFWIVMPIEIRDARFFQQDLYFKVDASKS